MECDTNSDLHYFGGYEYPREYDPVKILKIVVMEGESDEKCVINITFSLMMPSISSNNYQRTASLMNMNSFALDKARHPTSLYSHVQPSSTPFSQNKSSSPSPSFTNVHQHFAHDLNLSHRTSKDARKFNKKRKSHLETPLCRYKLLCSA